MIRDGAAKALGIHARAIETAGRPFPVGEHIAATFDPFQSRLCPLGGLDPPYPIPARDGRDVRPYLPRLRLGRELLGVNRSRVSALFKSGKIKGVKLSHNMMLTRKSVEHHYVATLAQREAADRVT